MVKDALRIAELEKLLAERTAETIQMSEQLSVINSVQEALVKEMDLQAIYDLVGNRIQELFDAQAVIIATFDIENDNEVFQYVFENGERFYPESRPIDKLRKHLIETKQKFIFNTEEETFEWLGKKVVGDTKLMKSGVFVPLITGDKVTSYISLQNVEKENAFSDSEIRLLETLANSMSTALENARLLKETEQRTAELAVINSVQEGLAKELDIQAIYDLVGNRIRELFDAQVVGIATFDHEKETENIQYLIEKGERYYPTPKPLNTLRKHLIQTKEKVVINKNFSAVAEAFGMKAVPGTQYPKSAVYVPLVIGDKVTGYTSLQNIDKENAFSESDIRLLETLANSMGVALENARLFDETTRLLKETEQQKAELGVINSVQEGLAKELDMQAIYDLVGDRIRELFNAQAVVIANFDHDTATEHFKYLIEDGQRFYLASRPYDKLRQHLIINKQKIVINSNYAEAYGKFGLKTLPGTNPTKSGVFVPLIIGDKVNSYISLQNNETENAFSESDVRLLETLANSMSVALENARLFDETTRLLKETEQRTAELAVINSVQEGLARELDINAIYDLVGNKIRDVFDAQAVVIATFEHETGMEKFNFLFEKGERYYAEPRRYDKLRYQLIMTKQKILVNSKMEEAFAEFGLKVVSGTEMPKSLLFVPLIVGNRVTSYVSLQNADKENAFSDADVRLLETLANSMSVALENARLFDETTRLLKETEQRTAELSVINSVQGGLAKEIDMHGIYELVGEKIREIFNAQVIDIATYDSKTNLLEDRYAYEKGDRTLVGKWEPSGFRKHVIDKGELILINEKLDEKAIEFSSNVIHGEYPKSAVFVPMISGGNVSGMISLQNLDKEHAFSDSNVNLLTTLSHSMSIALESARRFDETNRLLKETEQRNAELAVINSVQESLVAKMDMQGIYELVGEKIREIFDAQVIDIVTYDRKANLIEDRYSYEKGDRTLVGPREPKGFRKHVIQSRQLLAHNENVEQAMRDYDNEILIGEKPKSQVYVPMIAGGEVKGIISLQNLDHEQAFSNSDINLITTLANSMSVALESARLFDETTRLLNETEQRTAELSVINSVQDGLAKELDIQGIYELVGEKMREIFNAQVIDIATYDSKTNLMELHYSYEKGDRSLVPPWEPFGFRKHIIETAQPLVINEDLDRKAIEFNSKVISGEMPKSMVFVPLISGNEVKGMISLQNIDEEHAFSDSAVSLLTTLTNSMIVALENARLFDETNRLLKETEQRNAELAVINSVQESLVAKMDINGIYELVGEKFREIFDAQVIDIVTYDSVANLIEDRYAYEKGDRTLLGPRPVKGFRRHVIKTKQLLLHNDNVEQATRDFHNEILIGEMPKSQVYVPMIAGGEVKGIISLQNVDHEHAFSESDVKLLTTLANSMSVALESARLFDETTRLLKETEQRTAELAVINSVQDGLAKELDMQAIYDLVGERIIKVFNAPNLVIRTFDHDTGQEFWRYAIEKGERQFIDPKPFVWHSKQLIQTQKPIQINDNYLETSIKFGGTGQFVGQPTKSGIFVPMIVGGIVKGSVSLQHVDKENAYSEADLRLLTTITNSMSVALENARLFDETTRLLKETEQRTAELSVINSVQDGLARELDIRGIYDLVGEKMREIFNAQVIDIVAYDKKTNLIEDCYTYEKGDRTLLGPRPLKGFRKHVIETAKPLVINKDVYQQRSKYDQTVIVGKGAKSIVLVPMIAGGEVTGVISLQNLDQENAFSDSDVNLLNTLSNSMSVALESARLFDETTRLLKETEQRTAELAVINSVQEGLAKELDMQGIYDLIGDRVQKLFNAQSVIIATLDLDNKVEHFNYAIENGIKFKHESRPINKLRKLLIQKKHSIYIPTEEIAKSEYGLSAIPGTKMSKSLLFVPLLSGNIIRGYVSLQNVDIENAFSESDIRLLETLANSMSVALENARLFDETNRLLKETEQRTAELAIINSVQEGLASKLEIQSIYDLVGDKIRDVFDTQGISISFYDRQKNFITHPYYLFKGERIEYLGFELGKGLTSHIIQTAQPLLINSNAVERFKELGAVFAANESEKDTAKSWLGVPLMSGGLVNGTIRLENYEREFAYSESDVSLLQTLANSMSVALENARLFDETNRLLNETEQRTAELAVINSVQEGLAKELDMKGIYDLIGDRLCELFPDTQTLVIRTFDHANEIENFHYAIEKGERFPIDSRPFNWNSKQLILTKKPLDIEENYTEIAHKFGGAGVTKGKPPKSAVFVPMLVGDIVKGSVSLQNVDRENAFTDSDLRLLTTITNSMSVALENARLFDETNRLLKETEQRTAELAVINSVQEGLAKELDMQGIYDLVGDRLCELFPDIQTLVIRTFDHANGMENFHYAIEKGERFPIESRPFIWASKQLILDHKPIHIHKDYIETSKKFGGTGVTKGKPPKSAVFVPMLVGDVVKGSVSLQNVDKENAFTDADLRLLTTITNSMSVALENARLFDETTLLLAESKQRAAELSTVNSISKALAAQLDPDDLINMVGDQLKNLFKANIVYLAILDPKTKIISFPYQYGDNMEPLKLGEGLTSKIILTGEPILINKDLKEQRKQMGISLVGLESASYLGVPIPVGDENIGVLSVQSTEHENLFNENDLRLLSTIGSSVGVALRNATLFEDVQQAKMEAETASKLAEKANEAKSAFLSTVSHELRTPLTSVLGFAKIIKKRLEERIFPTINNADTKTEKAVKQVSENLEVVISEGTRLTHLINDVLDLAKIEAGKMEFAKEDVSMFDVAERALAATTSLFEQKSLKLIREIDDDLPEVTGDKDKLIQVMINLISNSVKFTDEGSITCRVKKVKNEIIASITDTGIGIAPEDFGAVFEQFKQVGGDTLTDKPKGTGLGLPICKEIVEHLGGRIWLESKVGKGSTFSFALPIEKPADSDTRPIHLDDLVKQLKVQVANSQLNIIGTASTILIVDDDESIRSLLHQELGDAGYHIVEAANGKEALDCVRKHRPDLIILDIMMPEMNGFDVAAVLKNDPNTMDIPIIVLSVVQDKARGFRIGVDRYLTKPIDTNLLFSEVGSLLEQGHSRKKVMIVDEDANAVNALSDVLKAKGYEVTDSKEKELVEKAKTNLPDIIIINSVLSGKQDIVQTLRFEKGLEKVLFVVYQ